MIRNLIFAALMGAGLLGCATHHDRSTGSGDTLLYLYLPEAHEVEIAASVDDFRHHPASPGFFGTWTASVPSIGEFQYFYIVDGKIYQPDCRFRQADDFGMQNCIHQP